VKTCWFITILVAFAALNACKHEASVERSSIWIDVAGQGDPNIQAGLSKEMIYVKRPAMCVPRTECALFVAAADERSAILVKVQLGQVVGNYVEVRHGLKPGDRVIISDMSAQTTYPRIDLR
jgi:multidrug efflux pump subunit AcrA (membrane-fusion protein)